MANARKIFVCSAGFGEGHHTAAHNLADALNAVAPDRVDARFVDILGANSPRIYGAFRQGYVTLMNRAPRLWSLMYGMLDSPARAGVGLGAILPLLGPERDALAALLERERPAAVVSTYPLYGYLLDDIARRGGPSGFLRVTVVTDSITVNASWHGCASDFYSVANEDTAAVMRRAGVPDEKLRVLGFPVASCFAGTLPPRPDPAGPEGRRVLYMINAGRRTARETVRRLLAVDGIDLTITVGRNEQARMLVENIIAAANPRRPVKLIGWTRDVPALMAASHLLISKAGGATTQETIAAGCPMIISQIFPGQEEGNAHLLINNAAGRLALTPARIAATVEEAFADDARLCREWTRNIARLRRPDAARDNARFILEQMEAREATSCSTPPPSRR